MEDIEHLTGCEGPGRVALVRSDLHYLARLEGMRDSSDGEFERSSQNQGPLLVGVGVLRNDRPLSDVNASLSYHLGVDVAPEETGCDFARGHSGIVKESHQYTPGEASR
jgi:hypothetical protein